jgi:predicted GNAT superfamily acetyltransferase
MSFIVESDIAARQAATAATRAALTAGVRIVDEHEMDRFHDIDNLFKTVWGLTSAARPIQAELLRSMSHGGAIVTAAYDAENSLCGAAVLIGSATDTSVYSLITGVLPRAIEHGVGFAIKQHQRAVALERGIDRMLWTFDPLVSRNARFNLTKLGASATEYIDNFYGQMQGAINANDESDRLVATWQLNSERVIAASEGRVVELQRPAFRAGDVRTVGPDGAPVLVETADSLWCRVPHDIVALRQHTPELAAAWRRCIRTALSTALASGYGASWVSRDGWYRLTTGEEQ